jgi:hypothetical protein
MFPRALALAAVSGLALSASADPIQTKGVIDDVTVYRGQALVSRAVTIDAGPGLAEILVTDLPEQVVPASLYAESNGQGIEVRSVRYRIRPVLQDVNEEVRKLDDRIRDFDDKLRSVQRRTELLTEHKTYLVKLEGFVAPAATVELSKGVLNAQTLTALTEMLVTQRQNLAETELKLILERRDLEEQKTLAQRERETIAGRSNRTVREAVILANIPAAAKGRSLRLRYLVNGAGWSPSYTMRSDGKKDKVTVEYHAAIQQMSGEDWGDVSMTLSTATPSLVARSPELKPMQVSLTSTAPESATAYQDFANTRKELGSKQKEADQRRSQTGAVQAQSAGQLGGGKVQGAWKPGAAAGFDETLNTLACDMQLLDLLSSDRVARITTPQQREESLSITYTLAAKTSLPSRADVQQVQIASMPMPAEFYKVATPVLTEYIYDEAQAINDSKLVLLAGPVTTYIEGRYVGSGEVPTVSSGEKFIVGFGIDSSLRASRELVEKTENVQGGNRIVDVTYRLAIDNFGEGPAKLRLMDRLPKAHESEIKLTLLDGSAQATAPDVQKKTGLLRWDITAPQGSGAKAFALEYKFRLEHDKQLMISGMPVAAK